MKRRTWFTAAVSGLGALFIPRRADAASPRQQLIEGMVGRTFFEVDHTQQIVGEFVVDDVIKPVAGPEEPLWVVYHQPPSRELLQMPLVDFLRAASWSPDDWWITR